MDTLNQKVLMVCSSKYGYIVDIAYFIIEKLNKEGIENDFIRLDMDRPRKWPSLDQFNGMIIGSYKETFRFWGKNVKKFVRRSIEFMDNKVTAIFTSDPTNIEMLLDPIKAKEDLEKKLLKSFNITPDLCEVFGPVLDFSKKSILRKENVSVNDLRSMGRRVAKKTGIQFDYKGYNDFRNWVQIDDFVIEFINLLENLI